VTIGKVELRDGALEFHDATVRQPVHKIRLEQLQATIDDWQMPRLHGRTRMQLDGTVKGMQRNGKLSIEGLARGVGSAAKELGGVLNQLLGG
jgi:hypothetical protein